MAQRRTDLAVEAHQLWREGAGEATALPGIRSVEAEREGFPVTTVTVTDEKAGEAIGKAPGVYITLELEGLLRREEDAFRRAVRAIAGELSPLLPEGPALVAGLGNRAVTPDVIGPLALEHLLVTRHLVEQVPDHFGHLRPVAAVSPGVLASTGVESAAAVSALARELKPACAVVVDALAARSLERLCRTVQLSDTGIVPGSGVGNHRQALDRDTLGVPVFSVGVPTVVDGATLALDLLEGVGVRAPGRDALAGGGDLFVTPRDIDSRAAVLAKALGYGISLALNPSLTAEDLTMLLE